MKKISGPKIGTQSSLWCVYSWSITPDFQLKVKRKKGPDKYPKFMGNYTIESKGESISQYISTFSD